MMHAHLNIEVARLSRKLKLRLYSLEIDEDNLVKSRLVSAVALKEALSDKPKVSLSTLILLENATGSCLYIKFVPVVAGEKTHYLKLANAKRSCLAATIASFFKPRLKHQDSVALARRSGLSVGTIKNLKNDSHLPNLKTIFKMSNALGYECHLMTLEKPVFSLK